MDLGFDTLISLETLSYIRDRVSSERLTFEGSAHVYHRRLQELPVLNAVLLSSLSFICSSEF